MNKKPILFSTPMVKAILGGRKTMTRRVVKPQPENKPCPCGYTKGGWAVEDGKGGCLCGQKCTPRFYSGDILWVRETWNCIKFGNGRTVPYKTEYWYKADDTSCNADDTWRPSIFMPYEAARLFLEVNAIRVERLQDISEEDARAEGIKSYWLTKEAGEGAEDWHESSSPPYVGVAEKPEDGLCDTRRQAFKQLWDSLNAKRGYSWESNPWVWVIEFKRVEK